MSTNPRKRSTGLKVSITPNTHAHLVAVAEAIGQTPATAAAFAIGQWVSQQKRTLAATENAINSMVDRMAPELVDQLKTLSKEKP
jgi:hypothetical protein